MTEVALSTTTHILSPVRPDRFSKHGLSLLDTMLDKLNFPITEPKLLAIMNGVQSNETSEVEIELTQSNQEQWSRERKFLRSRIAASKLLEARPAPPTLNDYSAGLAYRGHLGGGAIKTDLMKAADELVNELSAA